MSLIRNILCNGDRVGRDCPTDTVIKSLVVISAGHDKPFCTKAITIIDDFKKALDDTDN